MEKLNPQQIVDEIRELSTQYLAEVPSKRRTWPKSIKERVFQLLQLEPCEEISRQTGIPAATIYSWTARLRLDAKFLPVKIVEEKREPVVPRTVPLKRGRYKKVTPTIIVVSPNGIRFEGLDIEASLRIAREMRSWV
jgi:transposase-like protein